MELLNPTEKFIDYVYYSRNYLNCPKFIFNSWIDDFYRHAYIEGKSLQAVYDFLKQCNYPSPLKAAEKFVDERSKITFQEFNKLNVNSYIDKLPPHIEARHYIINKWYEQNTKEVWRYGILISKTQPSYPYRTSFR